MSLAEKEAKRKAKWTGRIDGTIFVDGADLPQKPAN